MSTDTMTSPVGHELQSVRSHWWCLLLLGIALVVMDVSLVDSWWEGKQVNGVDLCRLLKTDPQTIGVPVVLATAHAMRGDMERLLSDSGADDYVAKPIVDHDKFLEQIQRWVQSEAA